MMLLWSTIIATLVGLASAAVNRRDSGFKVLSQDQIDSTNVYAYYSAAVTCNPQTLPYWNCGSNCDSTPNFELTASGGGSGTPYWFVGYDNSLDSIIVSHQGNDKNSFFTNLANADGSLTSLDPTIFPNISNVVQVYQQFANDQALTAPDVLQAAGALIQQYPDAAVTVVGFSLGATIALLDGVLFRMLLDPTTEVRVVAYGMPRIGNQAFAGFVDAILPGKVKHINNKRDPLPVVPALSLGFQQPSGEIHIQQDGSWVQCPGEDNGDSRCSVGTVTSINDASFGDHSGPYNGVMINCNS